MKNVIYTCITGDYDYLYEPNIIDKNFDYICFTDQKETMLKQYSNSIWQIKELPLLNYENLNNVKIQRYLKICPHLFLKDYNYSIWVDANIKIKSELTTFLEKHISDLITIPKHPYRNCIYDEMEICLKINKDTLENMKTQINRYKQEQFPANFGLCMSGIILRKHNDMAVIKFMNEWWEEVKNGSHRDQLSFNYIEWKQHMHVCYESGNIFNSSQFEWLEKHKN